MIDDSGCGNLMDSKMLCLVLVLFVLIGGCNTNGSGTPAEEPTPKPLPEKPQELTNESVATYVAQCERVTFWNDVLDEGVSDVQFEEVDTRIVSRNETGFASTVYVHAWLHWETPEPEGLGFEYTALYVVNNSTTTRQTIDGNRPMDIEVPCE